MAVWTGTPVQFFPACLLAVIPTTSNANAPVIRSALIKRMYFGVPSKSLIGTSNLRVPEAVTVPTTVITPVPVLDTDSFNSVVEVKVTFP